ITYPPTTSTSASSATQTTTPMTTTPLHTSPAAAPTSTTTAPSTTNTSRTTIPHGSTPTATTPSSAYSTTPATPTSPTTTSTTSSTKSTAPTAVTSSAQTTDTTTTMTTIITTSERNGIILLTFRMIRDFQDELNNSSSAKYKQLAQNVSGEVSTLYKKKYPLTFLRCEVKRFWSGSVGVDVDLIFRNETVVPNITNVISDLQISEAQSETFLNIIPSSINATLITSATTTATTI
uniref:SEA domain-containing protein n=1 Tax=Lepisosteus oculatus TaxID=7918 RepID=W5MI60_LEPOC